MSEQTVPARIGALEQQLAQLAQITERNATAIDANEKAINALIHLADSQRADNANRFRVIETRLDRIERQLLALNESNQLIAELIRSRLPAPGSGE